MRSAHAESCCGCVFAAKLSVKVIVFLGLNETVLFGDQQFAGSSPFVSYLFPSNCSTVLAAPSSNFVVVACSSCFASLRLLSAHVEISVARGEHFCIDEH